MDELIKFCQNNQKGKPIFSAVDIIDWYDGIVLDSGKPKVEHSARGLGARPGVDIPIDKNGYVHPNTGGVSVSPAPQNLPPFRRPPNFGGTGKDPVWKLNTENLGNDLKYVPDKPGHGTIQPSRSMHIENYQKGIADTQSKWKKICS